MAKKMDKRNDSINAQLDKLIKSLILFGDKYELEDEITKWLDPIRNNLHLKPKSDKDNKNEISLLEMLDTMENSLNNIQQVSLLNSINIKGLILLLQGLLKKVDLTSIGQEEVIKFKNVLAMFPRFMVAESKTLGDRESEGLIFAYSELIQALDSVVITKISRFYAKTKAVIEKQNIRLTGIDEKISIIVTDNSRQKDGLALLNNKSEQIRKEQKKIEESLKKIS